MQTKNYFLNRRLKHTNARSGFALIAAVFLLIIISAMLTVMLSQSAETAKKTVNNYLHEQAILLAYGATEFAVLRISQTDRSTGCIQTINASYPNAGSPMFNITTTVNYFWSDDATLGADRSSVMGAGCASPFPLLSTVESHGFARIDVIVESAAGLNLDEPIRFHRRTLQKL